MDDPETLDSVPNPKKVRSGEDFDIIIGFLGFWALILFITTAFLEVTGKAALLAAVGLLGVVLALWAMIVLRRRLPARTTRRTG